MNVFSKIITAMALILTVSFSASASAVEGQELKGEKACEFIRSVSPDSETNFSYEVGMFICNEDLAFKAMDSVLRLQDMSFVGGIVNDLGYTNDTSELGGFDIIAQIDVLVLNILIFIVIGYAVVLFYDYITLAKNGDERGQNNVKEGAVFVATCIALVVGFFLLIVILSLYAYASANGVNLQAAMDSARHYTDNSKPTSKQIAYANVNAEKLFHMMIEDRRTKQALMYKNSYLLAEGDWKRPLAALYGKDTILKLMSDKAGYEIVGNTDNTYEFELTAKDFLGVVPAQLYEYFTSADYLYSLKYQKLPAGTFDFSTKVGHPSSIGTITINNTPSANLVDPQTADADTNKFRKIMVAAADSGAISADELFKRVDDIRQKIKPSIKDGKIDYVYADYSSIKDTLKKESLAAYNSQLTEIKDFSKISLVRTELGARIYGNIAAAQLGFHKNRSYEAIDNRIFPDFWNGVMTVNCARKYEAEVIKKQYTDKLNAYNGRWAAADDIFSKMDWSCVDNNDGVLYHYVFNPETEADKIQEAYALGKASVEAYKIYWGLVIAANQEAMNETLGRMTNPMADALSLTRYGFISIGAIPAKVAIAQNNMQKMNAALTNIVSVVYNREGTENNTYINPTAVFGNPDGEYTNETQKSIDDLNRVYGSLITAPFFVSTAGMTNGSLSQFKNSAESVENDNIGEKTKAYFEEVILADMGKAVKYVAQLDPNKTISKGIQECKVNLSVCEARPELSLYSAVVMLGKEAFDVGTTGLMTIYGIEAVYSTMSSFADSGNAVGGSVGKAASGLIGFVGGVGKAALAGIHAVAVSVKPMFFALTAAGLTGGYMMPAVLVIAPFAIVVATIVSLIALKFLIIIAIGLDVFSHRGRIVDVKRVIIKGLFIPITILLFFYGWLLVVALLNAIPASIIVRYMLEVGLSDTDTLFTLIISVILSIVVLVSLWRISTTIANRLVESVNGLFKQNDNGLSAAEITKTVETTMQGVGIAAITYNAVNTLSKMTNQQIQQLSKQISDEEEKRRLQEEAKNATPPVGEGGKTDASIPPVESSQEKLKNLIDNEKPKPSGDKK